MSRMKNVFFEDPILPFCWQNEMVRLANWQKEQNQQNEKCLFRFSHSVHSAHFAGRMKHLVKLANWQNDVEVHKPIFRVIFIKMILRSISTKLC